MCLGMKADDITEIILKRFRLNATAATLSNVLIIGCIGKTNPHLMNIIQINDGAVCCGLH